MSAVLSGHTEARSFKGSLKAAGRAVWLVHGLCLGQKLLLKTWLEWRVTPLTKMSLKPVFKYVSIEREASESDCQSEGAAQGTSRSTLIYRWWNWGHLEQDPGWQCPLVGPVESGTELSVLRRCQEWFILSWLFSLLSLSRTNHLTIGFRIMVEWREASLLFQDHFLLSSIQ